MSSLKCLLGCALLGALTGCGAQSNNKAANDGSGGTTGGSGGSGSGGQVSQVSGLLSAVTTRFPEVGAAQACVDTPLRLTFKAPVKLGSSGKIQVFKVSDPSVPADVIDMSMPLTDQIDLIGGRTFHVAPIQLDGDTAIVRLHTKKLSAGESYFVTVEDGVFLDEAGASLGALSDAAAWRFTTRSAGPADPSKLSVALDASGDFCSVQGALDFVPTLSSTPVTVQLKNGVYREIVMAANKSHLTLRGEDRKNTIIAYANNDNQQVLLGTKWRAMTHWENVSDLLIENLTLHNLTDVSGGKGNQAEALRIEPGERVTVRHVDVLSLQDTLLIAGHVYFEDCYIEGNVDFVWGRGVGYFQGCELKTVGRVGYNVQSRNAAGAYGFIFVDSKLTSTMGFMGNYLGRIDVSVYPGSQVAYVDCQMGPHIAAAGWVVTPEGSTVPDTLRFGEYNSTDLDGQPLDVSQRHPASRQLTATEATTLRDKVTILGWDPAAQ
ncbi:MAG: pectinesterase family protein [Polyangiaceae bacterium]